MWGVCIIKYIKINISWDKFNKRGYYVNIGNIDDYKLI